MTSRCERFLKQCRGTSAKAEELKKRTRFQFFAADLTPDILTAAIEGADALRHDNFDHEFVPLIYEIGLHVRRLLYGMSALLEVQVKPGKNREWALATGLALILEGLRRQNLIKRMPTDPFSKWQMRLALMQVPSDMRIS